jgi:hypothetical protein
MEIILLVSVLLPGLVLSQVSSRVNSSAAHLEKAPSVCHGDTTAACEIKHRKFGTRVDDGEQSFA